jgi:glycosyltransferase involved in cell wall biosynthesis
VIISRMEIDPMNHSHTETTHPDISMAARASALDPVAARSLVGLAGLPTIVAMGPFNDPTYAEQLAIAFTAVRLRCGAQLVLLGTGSQRATVMRRTLAHGVGTSVHVVRDMPADRWPYLIAAADVVVPNPAAASITLLDVLSVGRPVVAPADPAIVRIVVPASAGLVYRPGHVPGMAEALLRILTTPELRHGMGCRAKQVARRHHLRQVALQPTEQRTEHA